MTNLFGLMGHPVGHTLSPLIHQAFGDMTGEPLRYVPFDVMPGDTADAVRGAFALGVRGLNVTVPHKSDVMPYLTGIDAEAEMIGAVNTLVRQEKGYYGYNTDITGLREALQKADISLADKKVLILGAGGAARAAAFLAALENAAEVIIINRTADKAEALAEEVRRKTGRTAVSAVTLSAFMQAADRSGRNYTAIQCTSVGLSPRSEEAITDDAAFYALLEAAVDVVYRPARTMFLRLAEEAGAKTLGGLSMLLYQAVCAYRLWMPDAKLTNREIIAVQHLLEEELRGFSNLTLIGYMGSGKTTVAKVLADEISAEVWDTDRMIEEGAGKSVRAIFEDEGEAVFRRLETETLRRIISESVRGTVLSAGGGLVIAEENRRLLHAIGPVVYLRTRPETVEERLRNDETRPLLAGEDGAKRLERIRTMMKERAPLYEEAADRIIDTDGLTPQEIAHRIQEEFAR